MKNFNVSVREMELRDIDKFGDYWFNATPEFLVGMGVDLKKLPTKESFKKLISKTIETPIDRKSAYYLIWELNNRPIGHTNVNKIEFGNEAFMHLHIWKPDVRQRGIGTELVKRSLPFYFENLKLVCLYCEPYALNPGPNKTLPKIGFTFEKKYMTIPGILNFEQEVNRWKLTREKFIHLNK